MLERVCVCVRSVGAMTGCWLFVCHISLTHIRNGAHCVTSSFFFLFLSSSADFTHFIFFYKALFTF